MGTVVVVGVVDADIQGGDEKEQGEKQRDVGAGVEGIVERKRSLVQGERHSPAAVDVDGGIVDVVVDALAESWWRRGAELVCA